MKPGVHGAKGRMGAAILATARERGLEIAGEVDQGDPLDHLEGADVILDFSFHEATLPLLDWAVGRRIPVVIGTTGFSDEEETAIRDFAKRLPIVMAGNYSVGVNVLLFLTRLAAETLGAEYHPEIIEAHHALKMDAPSGTACNLTDAVLEGRDWSRKEVIHGREGITGERPDRQVGVHAIRGGGIIGDHQVIFSGPSERVELVHRAGDRSIFAQGALRAGQWLLSRPTPGIYSMQDVLGLNHPG